MKVTRVHHEGCHDVDIVAYTVVRARSPHEPIDYGAYAKRLDTPVSVRRRAEAAVAQGCKHRILEQYMAGDHFRNGILPLGRNDQVFCVAWRAVRENPNGD